LNEARIAADMDGSAFKLRQIIHRADVDNLCGEGRR
jgi:hypothetical protein